MGQVRNNACARVCIALLLIVGGGCSEARPFATRRGRWQHLMMRVTIASGRCDVAVYVDGVKAPTPEASSAAFQSCGPQGTIE
jgi:hypothetical protein